MVDLSLMTLNVLMSQFYVLSGNDSVTQPVPTVTVLEM